MFIIVHLKTFNPILYFDNDCCVSLVGCRVFLNQVKQCKTSQTPPISLTKYLSKQCCMHYCASKFSHGFFFHLIGDAVSIGLFIDQPCDQVLEPRREYQKRKLCVRIPSAEDLKLKGFPVAHYSSLKLHSRSCYLISEELVAMVALQRAPVLLVLDVLF